MISIFNGPQIQAAVLSVTFTVVEAQFAATATAETSNEFEWQVVAGGY